MYTEESMDYNDSVYVEEENNNFPWKKLLIRVLIIFVCLLLAIWLISKIVGGKSKNDGTVFNNNLDTIRLASEKYFFIENNLPVENEDSLTITLIEMNNKGLVETVRDYQENACSTNGSESYSTLKKTSIAYELTIKLTCKEEQKEITYYYDLADYKCLSCSGNTYMDGSLVLDSETDEEDNDENSNENNNEENNEVTYQKHIVTKGDTLNKIANLYNTTVSEIKKLNNLTSDNIYVGQTLLIPNSSNGGTVNISCDKWSDWTTIKLTDSNLAVRTRTLIKGYKNEGVTPVYGQWSEWTKTPITGSDTLQVETKTENEQSWSGNKTTTSYISNSSTIKVVDTSTSGGKKTCKTVYSNVRADLKPSTYTSYNSKGLIVTLHKVYNKRVTSNGTTKYTLMYDATYKKASEKCTTSSGVTTYTYQELVNKEVTYYRSRTITNEPNKDNTVYTDYVETLPEGYTKVDGSDLVQYSYKETICK